MNNEQKLIDICFDLVATIHFREDFFKDKTLEEKMEWVANQLKQSGFETNPCGSSWGILKK